MMKRTIPHISKRAFWDIDFNKIDWNHNISYLTIKVILDGTLDDIIELLNYYEKTQIINALKQEDRLPETVYYFIVTYYDLQKDELSCSTTKQ